jgi:hypothetical protein
MILKYKIAFTMDGETLFGLMSKFLPVEDLSIEELPMRPPEKIHPKPMLSRERKHPQITKPPRKKRPSIPIRLDRGINGIILTAMLDKPARATEIRPKVIAAGFSGNSLTSRMQFLQEHGVIEPLGDGTWRRKNG